MKWKWNEFGDECVLRHEPTQLTACVDKVNRKLFRARVVHDEWGQLAEAYVDASLSLQDAKRKGEQMLAEAARREITKWQGLLDALEGKGPRLRVAGV